MNLPSQASAELNALHRNGLQYFMGVLLSRVGVLGLAGISPAFGVAYPNLNYTAPYSITTLAGSPYSSGYQDGTGTNALFSLPYGLVIDSSGNCGRASVG